MTKYQQREGDGVLFKNDRKETEQHPDYQGSITIGGIEHWLSAWIKSSKDGSKKFMSLSARQKQAPAKKKSAEEPSEDFNDDVSSLPF